ncbi:MAG: VanZ family protein [Ignavibacteriae bacterium]|nr:VanZ family protein [Ignavibacteriota bacterium]
MTLSKNVTLWRMLAAGWAAMILFVLLVPGDSVPTLPYWPFPVPYDKTVHTVLFFVQAVCLRKSITVAEGGDRLFAAVAVALATSSFGTATEVLQMLAVARSASMLDAFADLVGACAGAMLVYGLEMRARKKDGRPGGRPQ